MVDALLPQTQCGLCGHEDGCKPYATSIINGHEDINKCVPGGQPVTDAIAALTNRDTEIAKPSKWVTQEDGRPQEVRAFIREDECIGCTKCISACPVDAIVGSNKQMHTIFTDLCTGCELCIAPCPVDCIDLVPIKRTLTDDQRVVEQDNLRSRYEAHIQRMTQNIQNSGNIAPLVNAKMARISQQNINTIVINEQDAKKSIQQARLRTQIKKLEKQLSVRSNEKKQSQLIDLQQELAQITD